MDAVVKTKRTPLSFELGRVYIDGAGVLHKLIHIEDDASGRYSQLVMLRWDARLKRFWWPVQFNRDGTYGTEMQQDAYGHITDLAAEVPTGEMT